MGAVLKHLAKLDIPGGGQVVAEGNHAYVGHMGPPHGTSIVDVPTRASREIVGQIGVPAHTHSHKVRVHGDVMLVNNEGFRAGAASAPDDSTAASRSTTSRTDSSRARSAITNRSARTASIRTGVTPISRPRKRGMSAISS